MNTNGVFSSRTDEWATPQWLFDELDTEHHFTLDPCATDENHKCDMYYTKAQDGLKQSWGGRRYSAIHHTADRSESGSRKQARKTARQ